MNSRSAAAWCAAVLGVWFRLGGGEPGVGDVGSRRGSSLTRREGRSRPRSTLNSRPLGQSATLCSERKRSPHKVPRRPKGALATLLFVGDDAEGVALEVVAVELADGRLRVIHAMTMRTV